MRWRWLGYTAACLLTLAPADALGDIAEVFESSRRIDPLTELDYRIRFPTPDHLARLEPPADRVGRERVEDARERVARAYIREITDAVADEVVDRLPLLAYLERRYDELTTFRLSGEGPRSAPRRVRAESRPPQPRFSAALVERLPSVRQEAEEATVVRLRLNGGGLSLSLAPTIELTRGALLCRLGYRFSGDRLELAVSRRLFRDVSLELIGSESLRDAGTEVALAVRLPF